MRRPIIALFSVIVLLILFVVLCTFVRRPYEIVLINRFGKIIVCSDATMKEHPPMMYNWYFKYPTDRITPIDTRLHLVQTPLQQVVTRNGEPISIKTFVAFRITDPEKFYNRLAGNDDQAKANIARKVGGLIQAKIATHSLEELFNTDPSKVHMSDMESAISTESTNGTKSFWWGTTIMTGVNDQGLEVVQVGFSRMAFPPSNADSVYKRMTAERNKMAQDLFTQGQAIAKTKQADGDAEAERIRGLAVMKAETIRGDGDRQADAILAAVQQSKSARDFYQYWKSLDFVKGSFKTNTYIVIPTDADWVTTLFNSPHNSQTFTNPKPESATTRPTLNLNLTEPINPMSGK